MVKCRKSNKFEIRQKVLWHFFLEKYRILKMNIFLKELFSRKNERKIFGKKCRKSNFIRNSTTISNFIRNSTKSSLAFFLGKI